MATPASFQSGKDKDPSQSLPKAEAAQFSLMMKNYDAKRFKKALKICNAILKTCPQHGETMAMKGLVFSVLDQKEEAHACVKEGLRASKFKSHVCWHVYGLILKGEHEVEQAIKSYQQALKLDPDNQQVWRELGMLQLQRLDLQGLLETRHKLLELKPTWRYNWMGYAMAHHLARNYSTALQLLDTFEKNLGPPTVRYEKSEFRLYKQLVLFESGDYKEALEYLDKVEGDILDKLSLLEARAKCLQQLEQTEKALDAYWKLIQTNPDNRLYLLEHLRLQGVRINEWTDELSDADRTKTTEFLKHVQSTFPPGRAVSRALLDVVPASELRPYLSSFAKPFLRRAIPSLFSALKSLYRDAAKTKIMEEVFTSWESSLGSGNRFGDEEYEGDKRELPTTHLWSILLLTSFNYCKANLAVGLEQSERVSLFEKALENIEKAIEHTPTVEMLYVVRGRTLKHLGRAQLAWESMEAARTLDTSDRYLNTKATKYHLRNNNIPAAEATISLFTSPTPPDEEKPEKANYNNVVDMQCMWYEVEEGDAYHRTGDILTALRKWLLVNRHFIDIEEDQYEFYTYCLRKYTMRAFLELLRFERRGQGHAVYQKAAKRVVDGYVELYDMQVSGKEIRAAVKVAEKPKKDEKKEEDDSKPDQAEEKGGKKAKGGKGGKGKGKGKDKEPPQSKGKERKGEDEEEEEEDDTPTNSIELSIKVETEKPLDAATPFANSLAMWSPNAISTHASCGRLYLRQKMPLLLLRHLLAGEKLVKEASKGVLEGQAENIAVITQLRKDLSALVKEKAAAWDANVLTVLAEHGFTA